MNCSHVGLSHYTHNQLSAYTYDNMIICQKFLTLNHSISANEITTKNTNVLHMSSLRINSIQEKLTSKVMSSMLSLTTSIGNFVVGKVQEAVLHAQQSIGKAITTSMTSYIKIGYNLYKRFIEIFERGTRGKAGTSINGADGKSGTKINGATGQSGTKVKGGR